MLNPFTPFGDCSLIRIANLYANVVQRGNEDELAECFEMLTRRSARLLRRDDYTAFEVGHARRISWSGTPVLPPRRWRPLPYRSTASSAARRTFSRTLPELNRPRAEADPDPASRQAALRECG